MYPSLIAININLHLVLVSSVTLFTFPNGIQGVVEGRSQISVEQGRNDQNVTIKCQSERANLKSLTVIFDCYGPQECDDAADTCLKKNEGGAICSYNGQNHKIYQGTACRQQQGFGGNCLALEHFSKNLTSSGRIQCETDLATKKIDYIYPGTDDNYHLMIGDPSSSPSIQKEQLISITVTEGQGTEKVDGILEPNMTIGVTCRVSRMVSNGHISVAIIHEHGPNVVVAPNLIKIIDDSPNFIVRRAENLTVTDGMVGLQCLSGLVTSLQAKGMDSVDAQFSFIVQDPKKPFIIKSNEEDHGIKVLNYGAGRQKLICNFTEVQPMPTFQWFHNGTLIKSSKNSYRITIIHLHLMTQRDKDSMTQSILTLPQVNFTTEGNFMCTASNSLGNASGFFNVTVAATPPKIHRRNMTNVETNVTWRHFNYGAHNRRLECRAEGAPPPNITWRVNDTDFLNVETWSDNNGTTVSEIKWQNEQGINASVAGIYLCNATNIWGQDQLSFDVSVFSSKPIFQDESNKKDKNGIGIVDVKFKDGQTHRSIICQVRGAPKPTITWLHDGKPFHVTTHYAPNLITESTLSWPDFVNASGNEGQYTCIGQNLFGTEYFEYFVDFPGGLKITSDDDAGSGGRGKSVLIAIFVTVVVAVVVVGGGIFIRKKSIIQRLREHVRRLDVHYQQVI